MNLGDSRLIVARGLGALRGTTDQKPESATEKRRIEKAGGYVVDLNGVWRATSAAGVGFGVDRRNKSLYLSVARSIGDRQLKKPTAVLSAAPDVRVLPLEDDDLLAVVVCDGVTDVLDDSAIVTLAVENFGKPEESARRIVREAFAKSAADNVTAVVVEFPWVDAAKVAAVRAKAKSAIAEAKKQQADEPLDAGVTASLRPGFGFISASAFASCATEIAVARTTDPSSRSARPTRSRRSGARRPRAGRSDTPARRRRSRNARFDTRSDLRDSPRFDTRTAKRLRRASASSSAAGRQSS